MAVAGIGGGRARVARWAGSSVLIAFPDETNSTVGITDKRILDLDGD